MNAREQAIEVMTAAVLAVQGRCGTRLVQYDPITPAFTSDVDVSLVAGDMLDALLAARVPTPCPNPHCDHGIDTRKDHDILTRGDGKVLHAEGTPCPDCEPPRPLVVLYDDLEQVGHHLYRRNALNEYEQTYSELDEPLYRIQHKESEAP